MRSYMVALCAALVSASGCHKAAAPAVVAPSQPAAPTGSSDRGHVEPVVATDNGSKESPPPDRSSFGPIYYAFDSAELDELARGELGGLGDWMTAHAGAKVEISGHTDERGTTEYNLALGERRATSAKQFLVRLGISADRVDTISYGEERPAAEGSGEQSWSRNRRCELRLAGR